MRKDYNLEKRKYIIGGFIVVIAGDMMLMPGLSRIPNAELINLSSDGTITGLS